MKSGITRRRLLQGGALLAATAAAPQLLSVGALAQDKPVLKFAAVFSDTDIRAEAMRMLGTAMEGSFTFEPHFGATLYKQGTELVALQRGNLETAIVAPQDIAKQLPSWSILTAAYLFRDVDHLQRFYASDAGLEMKQMAEEQLGIRILTPVYFGTRQVNLKPDRTITTPADMAGIKLRMPGGDAWQFLGTALGANPTPMAYAEVYTGLQTGAIDGQDNPLPNDYNMKFYEVMKQIVLTSHLVGYDLLAVSRKTWDGMTPEQQAPSRAAADEAIAWSTAQHLKREEPNWSSSSRTGPQGLRARRRRLPRLRPAEVPGVGSRRKLAGRHARQASTRLPRR